MSPSLELADSNLQSDSSGIDSVAPEPTVRVEVIEGSEIPETVEPTTSATTPVASGSKLCGVCVEKEAKYNCSQCELRYCSVPCSKAHRATHPTDVRPAPTPKTVPFQEPNEASTRAGTVGSLKRKHPFEILSHSEELQQLFLRYPGLRSQLREIAAASTPPTNDKIENGSRSNNRNFGPRRDRGFQRGKAPWSEERGMDEGVKALRRAQEAYGREGEGVREYCKLVMKIVEEEGLDAAAIFQREIAQENMRIVNQMLAMDR